MSFLHLRKVWVIYILAAPKQNTLPSFHRPSRASLPLGLHSIAVVGRGTAGFRCACFLYYWLFWLIPSSPTYCQMFSFRTWSLLVSPTDGFRRLICPFLPVLHPDFNIHCHAVMLICWPLCFRLASRRYASLSTAALRRMETEGTSPRIRNRFTRHRWEPSFTLRSLYPRVWV